MNFNHLLSLPQNVSFSTKYVANFKAVYNLHFWMEGSIFSPPNSNFCGCCFCFRVIGNYELLATITTILNFQFFIMIKCSYLSMTLWAENSLKDILNLFFFSWCLSQMIILSSREATKLESSIANDLTLAAIDTVSLFLVPWW